MMTLSEEQHDWLYYSLSNHTPHLSVPNLLQTHDNIHQYLQQHPTSNAAHRQVMAHIQTITQWLCDPHHALICYCDHRYPCSLRQLNTPPPVLYVAGQTKHLSARQLAIVGSRQPTPVGIQTASQLAGDLAKAGFVITSGLALGIDGAAHHAALHHGGHTIAVMGCGLGTIYPSQHRQLAKRIHEGGCLVSSYPLWAPPLRHHFPERNQIISALSLGTVVIEAQTKSGSLITARCAIEQGREVFAVPGSIQSAQSRGTHQLIRDGAILVETVRDVLDVIPAHIEHPPSPTMTNTPDELDREQQLLLALVKFTGTTVQEILSNTSASADTVTASLLRLELGGYIVPTQLGFARIR